MSETTTNSGRVKPTAMQVPVGPRELPVGKKLDNGLRGDAHIVYEIEERLGNGGFGIVYKAKGLVKTGNISNITTFAVKEFFHKKCSRSDTFSVIDSSDSDYLRTKERFKIEAEILSALKIPNIVRVNECFSQNNTHYYVMKYVEGPNLQKYVEENGALSEKEAVGLIVPIVEAVAKVHRHKMLHLDIKPNNIMLGKVEDGVPDKSAEVKGVLYDPILIDFGTSVAANYKNRVNVSYRSVGFSSPEQSFPLHFGYKNEFDPRLDIYALGATLYFLLTGSIPEPAPNVADGFGDFIANVEQDLSVANVSDGVKTAIVNAMNPNRGKRTATALQLLNELGKGSEYEEELREDSHRRKRIGVFSVAIAVAMAIIAFAAWSYIEYRETRVMTERLNDAVESGSKIELTQFAAIDSIRAVGALVDAYQREGNHVMAWYWADYAVENGLAGDDESSITSMRMLADENKTKINIDTMGADIKVLSLLVGISPTQLCLQIKGESHTQE